MGFLPSQNFSVAPSCRAHLECGYPFAGKIPCLELEIACSGFPFDHRTVPAGPSCPEPEDTPHPWWREDMNRKIFKEKVRFASSTQGYSDDRIEMRFSTSAFEWWYCVRNFFFFVFFGQKYFLVCQVGSCRWFGSVREESGRTFLEIGWSFSGGGGRLDGAVMGGTVLWSGGKLFITDVPPDLLSNQTP